MASHVQVVLKEDVDSLGSIGELVKVRSGYARNYLLPRGFASVATAENVRQIEHERKVALKRAAKVKQESQGVAAALAEITLQIPAQVGDEGRLYGSITAADVADALHAKGYELDRKKLKMPEEHIRQVGTYDVEAKLGGGVSAAFKVEVIAAE